MSEQAKKTAFVTGATGFVGFHIAKSLVENGINVRALARKSSRPSAVSRLESIGAEVLRGDILEPASYESGLSGVSYVFHAAAIHKAWTLDVKLLYRVNVDTVTALLKAAAAKGVEQFVYTSSIKAVGVRSDGGQSDESAAYNMEGLDTDYGISKYRAEEALLNSKDNITIKILNPAAVIGPGDETLTPTMEMINSYIRGRIKFSLDTCMGLVDVRDAARAHVLALSRARPKQRYILCAANMTMDELFSRLSHLTGIRPPRVRVPYWLAYPAAYLGLLASSITKKPPPVNPKSLNIACRKPSYCGNRASSELGIVYRDINQTLADSVSWLKERDAHR